MGLCVLFVMIGAYYLYRRVKREADESTEAALASAIKLIFAVFDCDRLTKAQLCRVSELTDLS